MTHEEFAALAADAEAAKRDDAPDIDKMWLQHHQELAVAYGLHPDAICASPLPNIN